MTKSVAGEIDLWYSSSPNIYSAPIQPAGSSYMAIHIYLDESGNLDFTQNRGATRYFIITSIAVKDNALENDLRQLHSRLIQSGHFLPQGFHAAEQEQAIRNDVFRVLQANKFRIDATIFDKPKVLPQYTQDKRQFYPFAWLRHLNFVAQQMSRCSDNLIVLSASFGPGQKATKAMESDILANLSGAAGLQCAFAPAQSHPLLQAADYCSWAIQRKWAGNDSRSYDLIKDKIQSEYDWFKAEEKTYY